MSKADLGVSALQVLKRKLTIEPKRVGDDEDDAGPIYLYTETEDKIGVARDYFLQNRRTTHEVEWNVTEGDKSTWPGDLVFNPEKKLRGEQESALLTVQTAFRSGQLGGMVKAPPGWGKTVYSCALIAAMQLPTLIIVHKEFLMAQWLERINEYLPNAKVGVAQQKRCEFEGNHIVVGMVHSIAKGNFPKAFYEWPGLIIVDECHRIGARTWAPVPSLFQAKYRLGVSATPRRKDGAEDVFNYHLGRVLFTGREQRLKPIIKRVFTKFKLVRTPSFNPSLAPESLILNFLCANVPRNQKIVDLMVDAVKAGRKLLILSKRINHLNRLEDLFKREWKARNLGPAVSTGYYIGGMTEEARYKSSLARVIFATAQFAAEGLDIPALDTLFLVTPMSDVEQAVGRIQRPFDGKKEPIVVDIRDDEINLFEAYANSRERLYARIA